MRMHRLAITPLLVAVLACGSSDPLADHVDPQPKVVAVDSEFTLRRGERAMVDGGKLIVTFLSVPSDSRCPTDVVCVWQGDAAMLFRLDGENDESPTTVDTLHTELQPRALTHLGFTVRVTKLEPYPHSRQDPGSRDYRATLIITKAGS